MLLTPIGVPTLYCRTFGDPVPVQPGIDDVSAPLVVLPGPPSASPFTTRFRPNVLCPHAPTASMRSPIVSFKTSRPLIRVEALRRQRCRNSLHSCRKIHSAQVIPAS